MSNAITALYREEEILHSCHCWLTYFRCAHVKEKHTYNFNTIGNVSSPHSSRYRRHCLSRVAMQGASNKPSQQQSGLQPDTTSSRIPTNTVQNRAPEQPFESSPALRWQTRSSQRGVLLTFTQAGVPPTARPGQGSETAFKIPLPSSLRVFPFPASH